MAEVLLEGLTKSFEDNTVVRGLDLRVPDGDFVTLLGPSGCGKTTTLRSIAGLELPDEGTISIGGKRVFSRDPFTCVSPDRRDIGMVFQSYALWPHMSVAGNVAYPLRRRKWKRDAVRTRVAEVLETVGLGAHGRRSVNQLSGGQQQRVALARAMASRPAVMLFDEPLSNLDARLRAQMRIEVRSLHERAGTTSIYVTHDQIEALTLSDRIAVMNAGVIEQIGTPADVYASPRSRFVADFMGFENIWTGRVLDGQMVELSCGTRLKVNAGTASAVDGSVELAIRSEHLGVELCGSGEAVHGVNSVPGVVSSSTYVGDALELVIDAPMGSVVAREPLRDGQSMTLAAGTAIAIRVPSDRLVALAAEDVFTTTGHNVPEGE